MSRLVLTALTVPLVFGALLACDPDVPHEPATTAIVDAGPTSPQASTESRSPREVLDREFRKAYAATRSALLEELRPVIIASGDELILKHGDPKRMTEDILANAAKEWIDNEFGSPPPPEPNPN